LRVGDDVSKPVNKIVPVFIIEKYASALNSADNNMMQSTGRIDSDFSGHAALVSQSLIERKL